MKRNNFTLLWACGRDYYDYMCFDIKGYGNVTVNNKEPLCSWDDIKAKYLTVFKSNYVSKKIFEVWLHKELGIKKNCNNFIVFSENYLKYINWKEFLREKKYAPLYTVLYINDPIEKRMNAKSNKLEEYRDKFDLIITTDNVDAIKYGLCFFPLIYSRPSIINNTEICYDLSFVGLEKDRGYMLREIDKMTKKRGINTFMSYKDRKITGSKWLNYSEIINIVTKSNCLLEVVQNNQAAITLRTLEAIYYEKKLLTNNKNIKKYSFYDPKYIQVFSDVNEINFDFVKEKIDVRYEYHDECSPINLIKYIVKKSKEKN